MKTQEELEREFKECSKCSVWKLRSEFYPKKTTKDGLNYICKNCNSIENKDRYIKKDIHDPVVNSSIKRCFDCKSYKRISEFGKDKTKTDGLNIYCKACQNSRQLINKSKRDEDVDYYNDRLKKVNIYHYDDKTKSERSLRWIAKNPEKAKAQQALRYRIRIGVISRLPCEICGDEKSEGHHEDYSKPYDVIWLCRKHHREIHRKYNTIRDRLKNK